MTDTLVIRIINQLAGTRFECLLKDVDAVTIESLPVPGDMADRIAAMCDKSSKIIILIPGEQVLLTQVQLPVLSAGRLMKALPFALEDQLIEDPSLLHFAIGKRSSAGGLSVAVISNEKMGSWQADLKMLLGHAYHKIQLIMPDTLALPYHENTISILIDGNRAVVRLAEAMGFAIEKSELAITLKLYLSKNAASHCSEVKLYQSDDQPVFTGDEIQQLGVSLTTHQLSSETIAFLADHAFDAPSINLLQGSYAPQQGTLDKKRIINIISLLLAVWFLGMTLIDLIGYVVLHREVAVLNDNLRIVYQAVYPNGKIPDKPKLVFQDDLAALRSSTQDSAFIRLVNAVSAGIAPLVSKGLVPDKAIYRQNQIILEITVDHADLLNDAKLGLEDSGLKVTQGTAERSPSGSIKTRFTIEEIS